MARFAIFLRGMNLGGRRISNDELCGHVLDLGFSDVEAFLASGNLVLDAGADDQDEVRRRLEEGLAESLAYDVPTFVRSEDDLRAVVAERPFDDVGDVEAKGKPQVAFLRSSPPEAARSEVLAMSTARDLLAFAGRELHWFPLDGVSGTESDWKAIERRLGAPTVRTVRTVERLLNKFF